MTAHDAPNSPHSASRSGVRTHHAPRTRPALGSHLAHPSQQRPTSAPGAPSGPLLGASPTQANHLSEGLVRSIPAAVSAIVERAGSRLAEADAALLRRLAANARALLLMAAGGVPLRPALLDLGDVVMGILPQWKRGAPHHTFELALPGSLPSVIADTHLAEQAFNALLAAAVRMTPHGATVRVNLRPGRDEVLVGVSHEAGDMDVPEHAAGELLAMGRADLDGEPTALDAALDLMLARAVVERHGGRAWSEVSGTGQSLPTLALVTAWPLVPPVTVAPAPPPAEPVVSPSESSPPLVARHERVILVVVADARMGRFLKSNLEAQAYRAVLAANLDDARQQADLMAPDLVLLDTGQGGGERQGIGLDSLRALLVELECPAIVLASQSDPLACAHALDLGAADCLARPFSTEELFARIRAALRRQRAVQESAEPVLTCGELAIDFSQRLVTVAGTATPLSKTEYKLLRALAQHPGKVLGHDVLLERVWGPGYADAVEFLWVYVRRLRRKIEPDPARPRYILTVPGVGYRLAPS